MYTMNLIQALGTLGGITDRDEMIKACKIIPDEDLRSALVLVALSFNNDAKTNDEIFRRQNQEICRLKERIQELETQLRITKS